MKDWPTLNVFNVQNFKTQQESNAAVAKGEVAQSVVAIYRALGGGWPSPFLGEAILEFPNEDKPKEIEKVQPLLQELPSPEELPELPADLDPLK